MLTKPAGGNRSGLLQCLGWSSQEYVRQRPRRGEQTVEDVESRDDPGLTVAKTANVLCSDVTENGLEGAVFLEIDGFTSQ